MVGPEERDGGTVTHIRESSHRGQALILFATITGSTDVKVEAAKVIFPLQNFCAYFSTEQQVTNFLLLFRYYL